jgi:hypothetical protein
MGEGTATLLGFCRTPEWLRLTDSSNTRSMKNFSLLYRLRKLLVNRSQTFPILFSHQLHCLVVEGWLLAQGLNRHHKLVIIIYLTILKNLLTVKRET